MSALSFTEFNPQSRQLVNANQEILTGIFADEVNLVSWQRSHDAAIADYCRALSLTMPLKRIVSADTVQNDIGFAIPPCAADNTVHNSSATFCKRLPGSRVFFCSRVVLRYGHTTYYCH